MSTPQSLEQSAKKYAARVEYRKRIARIIRRCACTIGEEAEYGDHGQLTYPGYPRCFENVDMTEEDWCIRCRRRDKLHGARRSACAAERNALRGLLNAAQRAG